MRLEAVGGETGLAVDDVAALTDSGGIVVIQAKGGLTLDTRATSALASAVDQAVAQFLDGVPDGATTRPIDADRDRLVILGNGSSSRSIRSLAQLSSRLRTHPDGLPLESAATDIPQDKALPVILEHVRRAWSERVDREPADAEVRSLLRVLVVDVKALGDDEPDQAAAVVHLRQTLREPAAADRAWRNLLDLGRALSLERSWRRRSDIAVELAAGGTAAGPDARYQRDVRTLRDVTATTMRWLGEHAVLPLAGGPAHCDRTAVGELVDVDGSFVLVGVPGCGKTGVLHGFVERLADEDVVVLRVDALGSDSGQTRAGLGLRHDLAEVLGEWSGTARATLVLDGLDAARGEATTWLGRLAASLRGTRWRVVASIRRFDLQHNELWQEIFRGDPVLPGRPDNDPELRRIRHYVLGDLTGHETALLCASTPVVAELLDGAPPRLRELLRNPFNLRLSVELVAAGETASSLAATRDQLQLLQRYWRRRVMVGDTEPRRARVLVPLLEEMLRTRRLRASGSQIPDALLDDRRDLLRGGVLQEVPHVLVAHGAASVMFSHHILFDFAVAALLLTSPDGSRLDCRLQDDPDFVVMARPSVDLHLADLWHAGPDRRLFASVVGVLVDEDRVLAGVAAARVMIENTTIASDVAWMTEAFERSAEGAAALTAWVCGAMEGAAPPASETLLASLPIWSAVAANAASLLETDPNRHRAITAMMLLRQLERLSPLVTDTLGAELRAAAIARVLRVALGGPDLSGLAPDAARLFPGAIAVDPGHVGTLYLAVGDDAPAVCRTDVLRHLVDGIDQIADVDPEAAGAVMAAAWAPDDLEDGSTSLLRGVVSLTSTRRQDREQLHWLTAQQFPAYLAAVGLLSGVRTITAVLDAVTARQDGTCSLPLRALGIEGRLLDIAPGLEYGPDHDVPATIVDAYVAALDGALDDQDAERVVEALVTDVSHPEFWARLLTAGSGMANWHRPLLDTVQSGVLLVNTTTRAAAAGLLCAVAPALTAAEHARLVEQPIRNAAGLFPPGDEEWRDRCTDQCLRFLELDRVQDPELLARLRTLLAGDGSPQVSWPPLLLTDPDVPEIVPIVERVNPAVPAAQSSLDELQALVDTGSDDGVIAVERLGETFGRAQADGCATEEGRVVLARAAERLAPDPALVPGTDLGEAVVRVVLDGASGTASGR